MFMPTTALGMAVTAIIGQCSGAGRYDRAKDYLKASVIIGGALISVLTTLVIIFSGNLTAVFGQGKDIALIVAGYFRVISIGFVLYMITTCIQGFITGIGKPEKSMIILIVYYIIIRIPAALILKSMYGLTGIWMAFLVSHILALAFAVVVYKKNLSEIISNNNKESGSDLLLQGR